MKYCVETRYALSESDVEALKDAGKEKKKYWSVKCLSDDTWIKYAGSWQLATTPFKQVMELEEGKEYQVSAGHWDVMNGNKHANQRRCFYVHQGKVYYCNYRDLPSQGGVAGASQEPPVLPYTGETAPASVPSGTIAYTKIPQKRCEFDGLIKVSVEDDCPICEPIEPTKGDNCRNCTMCQDLYVKEEKKNA